MLPGWFQNCPNCVTANTTSLDPPPSNFQNMIQNGFNNQGCQFLVNVEVDMCWIYTIHGHGNWPSMGRNCKKNPKFGGSSLHREQTLKNKTNNNLKNKKMNLRELKKMIAEEYRYWMAEQPTPERNARWNARWNARKTRNRSRS
jgi:hypothetical protein